MIMANEPKLENFFANLADKTFNPADLGRGDDTARERLVEVLWYLDDSRTAEVTKKLTEKRDVSETRVIMTNLTRLYPLSRSLVLQILRDIPQSDHDFVAGLDAGQNVYRTIKKLLNEAEEASGITTKDFRVYKEDVERLENQAKQMEEKAVAFSEQLEKKRKLEERISKLERETDEARIQEDIAKLEDKERTLQQRQKQQKERREKMQKTIKEWERELEADKDKLKENEALPLLRELLAKFPADAEDKQ